LDHEILPKVAIHISPMVLKETSSKLKRGDFYI
jgi:hypothetical protein